MTDNIKVAIKVRPLLDQEHLGSQWQIKGNTLTPIGDRFRDPFCFDYVFDTNATNIDVYNAVVRPITESALEGINGTIFTYGQTASGKTHTLLGSKKCVGIIELTIEHIFNSLEKYPDREFLLRASFIEIYLEKVYDLLDTNKQRANIQIREDVNGAVSLPVTEEVASTPQHLFNIMKKGSNNRKIGVTNMNERSSRSHTIFRIIIESRNHHDPDGAIQGAYLDLVDLAGSERLKATDATGGRLKEANHINVSLLTLSRVIQQLSESHGSNQFISYRDSKLTRILQSSLGGNAKTCIICTITPAFLEESHSTLSFAARAKSVVNKPKLNEILSEAALINKYLKQMNKLKYELEKAQNVNLNLQTNEKKVTKANQKLLERIAVLENSLLRADKSVTLFNSSDRQLRRQTWCPSFGCTPQKGLVMEFVTPKITTHFCTPNIQARRKQFSSGDIIPLENFEIDLMKTTDVLNIEESRKDIFADSQFEFKKENLEQEIENLKEFHEYEMNSLISENERCVNEMRIAQQENDKLKLELRKLQSSEPGNTFKSDKTFGTNGNFKLLNQSFKSIEKQIRDQIILLETKNYDDKFDINSEMIAFLKKHLQEVKLNYNPCYSALKHLGNLKREMRQRLPSILEDEYIPFDEEDEYEFKKIFDSVKMLLRQLTEHLVTSEWDLEQKDEHILKLKNEIQKANSTIMALSEKIEHIDNQSILKQQESKEVAKKLKRASLKDDEDTENTPIQKRHSDIQSNRRKVRSILQDSNRNISTNYGCEKLVCENQKNAILCDLEKQQSLVMEMKNKIQESNEAIELLKVQINKMTEKSKEQDAYVNELLQKIETKDTTFKLLEEQFESLTTEKDNFTTEKLSFNEEINILKIDLEQAITANNELKISNENLNYELEELKDNHKSLSYEFNNLKEVHDLCNTTNSDLEQCIKGLEEKLKQSTIENTELTVSVQNLKNQFENKSESYESLLLEFNNLNENHSQCQNKISDLEIVQINQKEQSNQIINENTNLKVDIKNLQREMENKKLENSTLLSDDYLKSNHDQCNKIKFEQDKEITDLKEKLNNITEENQRLKENYSICNNTKTNLEKNINDLLDQLKEVNANIFKYKTDIENLHNQIESKDKLNGSLITEINSLKENLLVLNKSKADLDLHMINLKEELKKNLEENHKLKESKQHFQQQEKNKLNHDNCNKIKFEQDKEITDLKEKLNNITEEYQRLKENHNLCNKTKISLEKNINDLLDQLKEVNANIFKYKTNIENLQNQIESKDKQNVSLINEVKNLKENLLVCNKSKFDLDLHVINLKEILEKKLEENCTLKESNQHFQRQQEKFDTAQKSLCEEINELKSLHNMCIKTKSDLENQIKDLQTRLEVNSKEKFDLENQIIMNQKNYQCLLTENNKLQDLNTYSSENFNSKIENLTKQILEKNEAFESLTLKCEKLSQEIEMISKDKTNLHNQIIKLNEQLNTTVPERTGLQKCTNEPQSQLEEKNIFHQTVLMENQKYVEELKGLSFKLTQKNNETSKLMNDHKLIKHQYDTLESKNVVLIKENAKQVEKIESLSREINDLKNKLKEMKQSALNNTDDTQVQNDNYSVLFNELKRELSLKCTEIVDLKTENVVLKNKLEQHRKRQDINGDVTYSDKNIQVSSDFSTMGLACSGTLRVIELESEMKTLRRKYNILKDGYMKSKSKRHELEQKFSDLNIDKTDQQ